MTTVRPSAEAIRRPDPSAGKVTETLPALERIGQTTAELGVSQCLWYLDRPVSNSGRLRAILEAFGASLRGYTYYEED